MRRLQKIVATIWTTALVSPILAILLAYSGMECADADPCSTGGPMPYAPFAVLLLLAIAIAHAAFLVMIWRGIPETQD